MSVYRPTYEALCRKLAAHDLDELVRRSGTRKLGADRIGLRCVGRDYTVTYPDGAVLEADGGEAEVSVAILLLLYLLESTGRAFEGKWISFEQLPGGSGYLASFRARVVAPILRAFGPRPEALFQAAAGLDGEAIDLGDVAVRLPALPCVPVTYVMWKGDDEFPPSANVVFDASVEGYLDAEVLTALAELATRRLVAAAGPARAEG